MTTLGRGARWGRTAEALDCELPWASELDAAAWGLVRAPPPLLPAAGEAEAAAAAADDDEDEDAAEAAAAGEDVPPTEADPEATEALDARPPLYK